MEKYKYLYERMFLSVVFIIIRKLEAAKINAMEIVPLLWIHIIDYYAVIKFSFENIFLKYKEMFIITYQVKEQKNKLLT